jgi:hypothetical protein
MADLKLETLIKVLMMTTSETDGEALAAIRRANSMLKTASVDWDGLLRGKVTVVADPFDSIAVPQSTPSRYNTNVTVPPQPTRQPPPPPFRSSKPPPPTRARPAGNTNRYPGECFICNNHVHVNEGVLLTHVTNGQSSTWIMCEPCNMKNSQGQFSPGFINAAATAALKAKRAKQRASQARYSGACFHCDVASSQLLARPAAGLTNQLFCLSCDDLLNNGMLTIDQVMAARQARASSRGPRTKRKVTTADLMKDIDF